MTRPSAATTAVNAADAPVGVQLSGNSQIGTFVQGIDAATITEIIKLSLSQRLVVHDGLGLQPLAEQHRLFRSALDEAERRCNVGQNESASQAFMAAFEQESREEHERQEDRRRLRLRLLEEGLAYDQRALKTEAALAKLLLIAEISYPDDQNAQVRLLEMRGGEFQGLGIATGDKAALQLAVAIFRCLFEGSDKCRLLSMN